MNMYKWIENMIHTDYKKALPVLSFPAVQDLFVTVRELVATPEYQAMGMRMIADRYDMPAAISYMDLSVEAEAFGAQAVYAADEVPTIIGTLISTPEEADALKVPALGTGRTGVTVEGIRKAVKIISDRPVIANCIGPYSLAGRLMNVNDVMLYCYEEPEMVHTVLDKATEFITKYMKAFKNAGADGVIMSEPLAGLLSPQLIEEFSTNYIKKIVDELQDESFIIIYHNCGNATVKLTKEIAATGCKVFHFGDAVDMKQILELMPEDCLCLGNISPSKQFRHGTPKSIRLDTQRLLAACNEHKNFLISSGCDVPPLTDWENIDSFFNTVESFYYRQRLFDLVK